MREFDLREEQDDILDDMPTAPPSVDIQEGIAALRSYDGDIPSSTILYGLSGVLLEELELLKPVWFSLKPVFRRRVMRTLLEASEADFMLDYRMVGMMGLGDDDPGVREAAIDVLWEDETLEVMNRLMSLALHDDSNEVRATAASALGRYILLGELETLPEQYTRNAQDVAVRLWNNRQGDVLVRRRALEAISNCGHTIVPDAIQEAYHSDDPDMRSSAIFAMGRTYDQRWAEYVLTEMQSEDPRLRYEAARAAGALELEEAVRHLGQLVLEDDREILEVSVWSLGEIGGDRAIRLLEALAEKADDEDDDILVQAVEDAMANATLFEDLDDLLEEYD